ncbi:hypothetical protein OAK87_01120 [bacterium]|nr:hypothetical protein [bacterium]
MSTLPDQAVLCPLLLGHSSTIRAMVVFLTRGRRLPLARVGVVSSRALTLLNQLSAGCSDLSTGARNVVPKTAHD